jgi:hypothetical protein
LKRYFSDVKEEVTCNAESGILRRIEDKIACGLETGLEAD